MAYWTFYFRPRIVGSYRSLVTRHPGNVSRLVNGANALLSRVFSS